MPGAVVLPMGGGIDGAFGDGSFETLYNIYGYVSNSQNMLLSQFGFSRLLQVKACLISTMTHLYNGTANFTIFSER